MKATALLVLCGLLLLAACGGKSKNKNDAGDGSVIDLKAEAGAGQCKPYLEDGATCGGAAACQKGQICVKDGASGASVCRTTCDPKGTDQCGKGKCGRVCLGLVDSKGKTLKEGACVAGWVDEGDPCGSGVLCIQKKKLRCIGGAASFCRKECTDAKQCKGYKIACLSVTGQSYKVCGPAATTSGVKEGGDCSKDKTYCASNLLCDPTTKKCLKLCTNLKGAAKACGACSGKTCKKIVDTQSSVTLGWACVPGTVSDAGPGDCSVPDSAVKEGGVKEGGAKEGGKAG